MNALLRVPPPFFPYGAPELKESARRHLSRALGAGSLLWVLAFAALALVLSRATVPNAPVIPIEPSYTIDPLRHAPPRPPSGERTRPPRTNPHAPPRPVPVDPPPPVEARPPMEPGALEPPGNGGRGEPVDPARGRTIEPIPPDPSQQVPVDELPQVVRMVKPRYPEIAKEAGVDGLVVAWALVGLEGNVMDVRIQKGIEMLNASAIEALRQWHFTPAWRDGHPVIAWVAVPIRYTLHGRED